MDSTKRKSNNTQDTFRKNEKKEEKVMEDFYKLYIKENEVYQKAEVYYSKKKLDERLKNIKQEYLLIHRHDDFDDIVSHKEAKVRLADIKPKIKVNATTFTTEELKKKRKQRKDERRKIQKEIDEWLDKQE